jgi:Tfp pilus assembly protein PilF
LLGAVNCFLVLRLAERVIGRRSAWIAYAIAALYGPFIFFEAELLAPAPLIFLLLLVLLMIDSYRNSPGTRKIIIIGLLLSLAQIGHGLTVAFLPFLIGWLLFYHRRRKKSIKGGLLASGYLLVGFVPFIIVTSVHNYALDREFVAVSSNFGPNFYLGNHPNYDSTTAIRPGLEWEEFIGEAAIEGYQTPARISGFYTEKAISNIADDIPTFAGLLVKKFYLLTAGEEIKRILDIYHFKKYSVILDLLIWRQLIAFPSGIILPLGVCGIFFFIIRRRWSDKGEEMWPMLWYLISQAAAILLFFVACRYRLVMMPVVIIFAAYAVDRGIIWVQQRRGRFLVIFTLLFCVMLVFCNIPRIESKPRDIAENHFYEGLGFSGQRNLEAAAGKYRKALEYYPDYSMARYNLALSYGELGQDSLCEASLDQIVGANPDSYVAALFVGNAYLDRGQVDRAENLFKQVLGKNRNSAEAHINLGYISRLRGDMQIAMQHLMTAIAINPRSYKAYNQIGACYLIQNMIPQAEQNFQKSYDINRSYGSAMNNLATIYSRTYRMEEAGRLLEKVVKLEPDNPEFLINYGTIRVSRGEVAEGLEYFDRAVAAGPLMPESHYYRGLALLRLGKRREAAIAFATSLKVDSTFAPAREELKSLGY